MTSKLTFSYCRKCKSARIFLFSATFEAGVKAFIEKFMGGEPKYTVALKGVEFNSANLLQFYIEAPTDKDKENIIREIYETTSEGQTLLFCETRSKCDSIDKVLSSLGFCDKVGKLHGKLDVSARDKTLNSFRAGLLYHLIVTNVLARGINIPEISLVINYDLPRKFSSRKDVDLSTYTHRVGRCTRWNRKGMVINLVNPEEVLDLQAIEAQGNFKIEGITLGDIESLGERLKVFRDTTK